MVDYYYQKINNNFLVINLNNLYEHVLNIKQSSLKIIRYGMVTKRDVDLFIRDWLYSTNSLEFTSNVNITTYYGRDNINVMV